MIFATGLAILTSVFPPTKEARSLDQRGCRVHRAFPGTSPGGLLTNIPLEKRFSCNPSFGSPYILVLWRLKEEWLKQRGAFDLEALSFTE